MDSNQVRARIIEVGQLVKRALLERGVAVEEREPAYQAMPNVRKQHRSPFWSAERGFKYIDDVDGHLRRLFRAFDLLNPREGSSVFEIGPGSCFFLFMCRELRGCQVAGVDWKHEDAADDRAELRMPYHELQKDAFHLFREHFGLEDVIRHQVVEGGKPIAFADRYDAIVATRAMFNHGWSEREYRYWLRDCYEHLQPGGQLMIHLNQVEPEHLALFPFLRPQDPAEGFKKLTLVHRATIGRVLEEKTT